MDLFCGAGGAAVGYHRAGFEVVGVDIEQQPNYPFRFVRGDALRWLEWGHALPSLDERLYLGGFDAVHASPPCQAFTAYRRTGNVGEFPDLIAQTRSLLIRTRLPWVIENVLGAPLQLPTMLCGSAFGLDVQRHRLFETSFPFMSPGCSHGVWARDRFPGGRSVARTGSSRGLVRGTVEVGSWDIPLWKQKRAMGVGWPVTLEELSEAVPPAYTEHIGGYLMAELRAKAAA